MAKINLSGGLAFVSVTLKSNGNEIHLPHVLLDTGSAATVFKTDDLLKIGIEPSLEAPIRFMSGIGGREAVIEGVVDSLSINSLIASPFTIQMGRLEYGFSFNGIIGLDFLLQVGAIMDFKNLEISKGS